MTDQELDHVKALIKGELGTISGKLDGIMQKSNAIHEQTTKTNGRVNRLEGEIVPLLHKRISDVREENRSEIKDVSENVNILKGQLTFMRWLNEKPIRFVFLILSVLILWNSGELFNVIKLLK